MNARIEELETLVASDPDLQARVEKKQAEFDAAKAAFDAERDRALERAISHQNLLSRKADLLLSLARLDHWQTRVAEHCAAGGEAENEIARNLFAGVRHLTINAAHEAAAHAYIAAILPRLFARVKAELSEVENALKAFETAAISTGPEPSQ